MWNGIYDWFDISPHVIDMFRVPPAVHAYLVVVLLVWVVPQRWVRPFILYSGLASLWLFLGLPFALGVVAGSMIVYAVTRPLAHRAQRTGRPGWPTAVGWTLIHGMYLPCFFVSLPQVPQMQPGELTQFCGIGFMVLKASQFVFDACRGRLGAIRWDQFLTFMTFLPTFRLGPVDRCGHFVDELETCKSRISAAATASGLLRVAVGTAKMLAVGFLLEPMLFPDPYNIPFGQAFFDGAWNEPVGAVWVKSYALYLRLYLIFSGYTDGAIGMCRIMGIRAPENFRFPLLCSNLVDFWRRWHMSMGSWLRDYVYIPLGGNRRRVVLATAAVFGYCGLWHFPVFAGPLFFVVVQTAAIHATRAWQAFLRRIREEAGGPRRGSATRLRLVVAPPWVTRLAGWLLTQHIMVVTSLFMFDHRHSGLRAIGRLYGLFHGPGN